MTMARNWRDIRADAVAQGRVDLQRAAVAREEMRDAVLAHRLAEIRKALGHARQADVAALMGSLRPVSPSWRAATCPTPNSAPCRPTLPPWAGTCASSLSSAKILSS